MKMRKRVFLLCVCLLMNIVGVSPVEAASNKLDIVFIIDRSGSMGGDISSVKSNISSFANQLSQQGIQYRLGLVSYEEEPIGYPITSNVEQFKSNLDNIHVSGGTENGLDAIMYAVNNYTYDYRAIKYFVIIGDETIHTEYGNSFGRVRQSLTDNNIILTAIATSKLRSHFEQLTVPTNGQFYNINSDYGYTLQGIFEQIQNIPALHVKFPIDKAYYSNQQTFIPQIEVSDEDSDVLICRYAIDSTTNWKEQIYATNTEKNQTVSFQRLDLTTVSQGWHDFYFEVYDGTDAVSETKRIYVDNKAPNIDQMNEQVYDRSIQLLIVASDDASGMATQPYQYSIDEESGVWTNASEHTYSNLQPNKAYTVNVTVRDNVGNTAMRSKNITTLAQVPVLGNVQTTLTDITVPMADDNPGNTLYQVQFGDMYLGSNHQLSASPQWIELENKKAVATNLPLNANYVIRSRAKNSKGQETGWSSTIEATTLAPTPTNLQLTPTQTDMTLHWDAIEHVLYYEVELDGKTIIRSNEAQYRHSGLGVDEEYRYRVRSVNKGGASPWTEWAYERTLPYPPEAPFVDTVVNGQTEVTIHWKATIGADSYEVLIDGNRTETVTGTQFVHEGLRPETSHTYSIRAINRGGISNYSEAIALVTYPYPPSKPVGIEIQKTNTSITLAYDRHPKAETYEVEVDGTIVDNGLEGTFVHNDLGPLTTHKYRIRGVNRGGKGEWSDRMIIQTHPDAPEAPSSLFGTSTRESISVLYNKVDYADYYEVEIDGDEIVHNEQIAFDHKGLNSGEEHVYRVRACNVTGKSPWSVPYTIASLEETEDSGENVALTNIGAMVTNRSISISWESIDYDVRYYIEADGNRIDLGQDKVYMSSNLEPRTLHNYKIVAVKDSKEFYCGSLILTTLPNPPDAPEGFVAEAGLEYVQLNWVKSDDGAMYELEVDGNVFMIGDNSIFKDENLLPGTSHTYRIRALNITGTTGWSEPIAISTLSPEFTIDLTQGDIVDVSVLLRNVQDFTGKTYVLTFDPSKLRVEDLSLFTPRKETEAMEFEPYNMQVSFVENQIRIQAGIPIVPGTSFDGELNAMRFIMVEDGTTTLTLVEEKE